MEWENIYSISPQDGFLEVSTGFGGNSNQGQVVTSIGCDLGLLVINLNDSPIILPIPHSYSNSRFALCAHFPHISCYCTICAYSRGVLWFQLDLAIGFLWSPRGGWAGLIRTCFSDRKLENRNFRNPQVAQVGTSSTQVGQVGTQKTQVT